MSPRGETLPELPPTTRFVDRADVKTKLKIIENSLVTLNNGIDHPTLNGSALFGVRLDENPDSLLSVAGTIALVNVDDTPQHRLDYGENILEKRKTLLAAAAFEDCVVQKIPVSRYSKMNIEDDFTFSYPLFSEDSESVIGGVQHAFHYPGNLLPEERDLLSFKDIHQPTIDKITRSLQWLYNTEPDLLTSLELAPAITPNRFAIRSDITNEDLLREINYGTYVRFVQHCKQVTEAVISAHCPTALIASIQDKNIILEFPKYIKRDHLNDLPEIRIFQNREIAKLSELLNQALTNLAESYKNAFIPDLRPTIKTSFGNGFFEKDSEGKLDSPLLHAIRRKNFSN